MNYAELLSALNAAVDAASDGLLNGHAGAVRSKAAQDVQCEADVAAQERAAAVLAERLPGLPLLGEESWPAVPFTELPDGVVLDPLDGTKNYIRGLPLWGVGACALVGGVPVASVIRLPELGERFTATLGGGSTWNGRPMSLAPGPTLEEAAAAIGFAHRGDGRDDTDQQLFASLLGSVRQVLRVGCAMANLSWLASGRLDLYVQRRMWPYDFLPGALLIKEAGGSVRLQNTADARSGVFIARPGLEADLDRLLTDAGVDLNQLTPLP